MEVSNYLVTLGVRPAEMSGLKELPGSTKDRLTPLLLLAPWLATSPLSRALDKFEESFPSRPYFVDIDAYYQVNDKPNEAKALWQQLADHPADVPAWWGLLEHYPNANPCLLLANQPVQTVRDQIAWARERSRNFCIRMNLDPEVGSGIPAWLPEIVEELSAEGANDYAVVFEFGWIEDPITVAALATGYTKTFFSRISPQVPVAISCTSFPRDFTKYDGESIVSFTNRELVGQVQRLTNHPRVVYGDWGTTRPRSYAHASQPKNRIDYPGNNSWLLVRNKSESIDFKTAAEKVKASSQWSGDLGIWGEQLIEATAQGQAFAIDTMPKMYAARINIHLHRQAFHDGLPPPQSLDEEWNDDEL